MAACSRRFWLRPSRAENSIGALLEDCISTHPPKICYAWRSVRQWVSGLRAPSLRDFAPPERRKAFEMGRTGSR